ncbi:MAG: reverse transcriptase family protein, partial [Actinomycetota bacterium]|nr:reverse transcriptase family protein [Actinomycetota bacterium]
LNHFQVTTEAVILHERGLLDFERAYLGEIHAALGPPVPRAARDAAVAYARNLLEHGFPVIFDNTHLAHVTGIAPKILGTIATFPERFYSTFRIPKRRGGSRVIAAPSPVLKQIQHWLQRHVTSNLWTHPACHGFVRGRSIVTNAREHVGTPLVWKVDLLDFFGSVQRLTVFRMARRMGYSRQVAETMTALTTLDGSLPQGAPTSPDFANFAAYFLDVRLSRLTQSIGATYTRYADDLTFSGAAVGDPQARRLVEHIIRSENFSFNDEKERFLVPSHRQTVTGIVVNEKANWPRDRRRWLRQEVHYLERFGVDSHLERRGSARARYKEFIYGHVYALNTVRPTEARDLLARLDRVDWPY